MLRCKECKGTNVHTVAWIDGNTNEVLEAYGSRHETATRWCQDCSDHCELEDFDPESEPVKEGAAC